MRYGEVTFESGAVARYELGYDGADGKFYNVEWVDEAHQWGLYRDDELIETSTSDLPLWRKAAELAGDQP